MRVIDPLKKKPVGSTPTASKTRGGLLLSVLAIAGLGALSYRLFIQSNVQEVATTTIDQTARLDGNKLSSSPAAAKPAAPQELSGNEFRFFYDNLLQQNVTRPDVPPSITGNDIADARIRDVAEKRGYLQRGDASVQLTSVDGYLLQESAQMPWLELKAAMRENGNPVRLTSGLRTVNDQRVLFLKRLVSEGVNTSDIAAGTADEAVDTVLASAAPPGYSKHHTGYTIDVQCVGYAFENFKDSSCHDALIKDNYSLAKQYGFIPSYPADADLQGPEPEAWEYVWVGADVIM